MKVYEAVASALEAEGAKAIFGLMGDGNMSLWGAIARSGRIEIYSARHEAAAVAMADGYHRATGEIGLATVTCGPGLTQVGTSLIAAARNRSAIVVVVGEIPAGAKNKLQTFDQRRFSEACSARYFSVSSAGNAPEEIAEAFYCAALNRCPVVLNLPIDLQEQELSWNWDYRPGTAYGQKRLVAADDQALEPILERLASARRPVIIAGRGAKVSGAKAEIVALADRFGALLATSLLGKGLFEGHPYDIGIAGNFSSAVSEQLFAEADFVLGVGAELGYFTSEGGLLFPSAEVARIDISPAPEEIGTIPGLYASGDALRSIARLNRMAFERELGSGGFRTVETDEILATPNPAMEKPDDGLDPRLLMRNLSRVLPSNAMLTVGVGHFFGFVAMYLSLGDDVDIQFAHQFGAVGQGLGVAIGVGVGSKGRPQVLIEGDGSILMSLQELETVARHELPMVLILWNDSGFGAEMHKLKVKGFDSGLAQWTSPDFVGVARAVGGDGVRLESEAQLAEAVQAGLKHGGLYLIDARVSPSTVSDPYRKVHLGLKNIAPLIRRAEEIA